MASPLADMASHERPRERLWAQGPAALRDGELLALVLRNGCVGESAVALADGLLTDFGGLDGLRSARPEELARRAGVGPAKAAAVVAACHLAARLGSGDPAPLALRTPHDVARAAMPRLAGARREQVLVLVVDSALRLRHSVRVTEGGLDRSLAPVRDVLNAVLRHDGRGFALVHNHPSGDPSPSAEDRRTTVKVAEGAEAVGLRFLCHVVVAGDQWAEAAPTSILRTPG